MILKKDNWIKQKGSMGQPLSLLRHHPLRACTYLTSSPGFHMGVYYALAARLRHRAGQLIKPDYSRPYSVEYFHLAMMPHAWRVTYGCRHGWPHHSAPRSVRSQAQMIVLGAGAAAAAMGILVWILHQRGWLHFKGPGWQHWTPQQVAEAMVFYGFSHSAVAYNEEMLFRGHGLTVLSQTFGPWAANGVLISLFVYGHPLERLWIAASAYALFGFNMSMLRLLSGELMLPMAYHATWNWLQSGCLGARPDQPSLVPIRVDGPEHWTGRFGEASPGLLMLIVQGITALILGWLGWRAAKHS